MNSSEAQIGLMGGTFDPIHNGHLLIAEQARDQFSLDQVVFIPTGNSPHKNNNKITDPHHRKKMLELAISANPHFSCSDYELNRKEVCYTYLTLEAMQAHFSGSKLFFIMGGDSLSYLDHWVHPERICSTAVLLVAVRDEMDLSQLTPIRQMLQEKYNADIRFIRSPNFSVSSHLIRERIQKNTSVRYLVPDPTVTYITENRLYTKAK